MPGRWFHIGSHKYGHFVLWDGSGRGAALYASDEFVEPTSEGRTERFLQRLFHPLHETTADATQFWAEPLAEADRLA